MKILNQGIIGIVLIIIGVLFIVMKGDVIGLALTVMGITLIVSGINEAIKYKSRSSAFKIVAGAAVIVFGWLFVSVALYAIAVILIVYSVMDLSMCLKTDGYPMSFVQTLRSYAKPIAGLIGGIFLMFNQGGTVSWMFVLCGVVLVIEGAFMLYESRM